MLSAARSTRCCSRKLNVRTCHEYEAFFVQAAYSIFLNFHVNFSFFSYAITFKLSVRIHFILFGYVLLDCKFINFIIWKISRSFKEAAVMTKLCLVITVLNQNCSNFFAVCAEKVIFTLWLCWLTFYFSLSSILPIQAGPAGINQPVSNITNVIQNTNETNSLISCSCAVFLSGQFVRGSPKPPVGYPPITADIEDQFPCNPIGVNKCTKKCLDNVSRNLSWFWYRTHLNLLQLSLAIFNKICLNLRNLRKVINYHIFNGEVLSVWL